MSHHKNGDSRLMIIYVVARDRDDVIELIRGGWYWITRAQAEREMQIWDEDLGMQIFEIED